MTDIEPEKIADDIRKTVEYRRLVDSIMTGFDFTSAAASLDEPAKPSKRIDEMDLDDYRRGINRIWRTPHG